MTLNDWLNLLVRWTHFIAGIAWIGSSFYFIWLDSHLESPAPAKTNVEGELWMVHSGGFYQVERRRIGPGEMPRTLHWFKWEAAITWMSGVLLLTVVYYLTGGVYLIDPAVARLSVGTAIAIGAGAIFVGWIVYDTIWRSPLGRHTALATALSLALFVAAAYGLCHVLSGRAAYMHLGAIIGTIMVANVWERILPAQQQMIDATKEGREPDYTLSAHAKRRSVHNSYMTFPVLFIMLSNHFPATYGSRYNWLILGLMFLTGAGVRHVMIAKSRSRYWALVPSAAALAIVIALTTPLAHSRGTSAGRPTSADAAPPTFAEVRAIVAARCVACHSATPTIRTFGAAPSGVSFDDPANIRRLAERIRVRVVQTKTMPLGNKTGMTEEERALLGRWIDAGAEVR
jgi:uncharacterized membrane protein